jgi:hypothetical protein
LAHEHLGAKVNVGRRLFVSQLVFHSNVKMALLNPILQQIIDRLTESISGAMNHRYTFDASVVVNAELWQAKITPGAFSIESYLMQDEPGAGGRFSYKMSLEGRSVMLGVDHRHAGNKFPGR